MSGHAAPADSSKREHRHAFWRHLLEALPVLLLVSGITTILGERGLLRGFENTALDVWLQLKEPRPVNDVVLVTIDDIDYATLFGRRSPLQPERVKELVAAVVAGAPRAVGVDLDSSDEAYAAMEPPPRVVWAREGTPLAEAEAGAAAAHGGGGHGEGGHEGPRTVFRAEAVLGRHGEAAREVPSGLALMPQDGDGIIRRYRHALPVLEGEGEHARREPMPTLGWAVLREADKAEGRAPRDASQDALVLNFAGDRYAFATISARDVIAGAKLPAWGSAGPLKDRIVLVGGTFHAARDEYVTPVGAMPGVQLVAQAIESELSGGGIRSLSHGRMLLLELLSGVLLVWINFRFRLGTALLLSLGAMPLLTLGGSLLAFSSLAYWFNFTPSLLGVWIHELIDHAREYRAMHIELHQLKHGAHAQGAAHPSKGEG